MYRKLIILFKRNKKRVRLFPAPQKYKGAGFFAEKNLYFEERISIIKRTETKKSILEIKISPETK
jgi:hypothetical protein